MFSVGVTYFIILFLIEYRIIITVMYFIRFIFRCRPNNEIVQIDDDVRDEQKRISEMTTQQIATHNLVLKNMTKKYNNVLAVNQLSVVVDQ